MCLIERDKYVWCLPKEQLPYMFKIDSVKQIKNILLAETDMFWDGVQQKKALNQLDKK